MLAQGNEENALKYLSHSISMVRQFTPSLHCRALIYRNRQMNKEALADLDTLLATDPSYGAGDYNLRGVIKVEMKDYVGARRDFEAALRLDPEYGKAKTALRELDRTVRDNQLLPHVRTAQESNESGVKAAGKGNFRAAAAYFRNAIVSDPGFYEVYVNLGNCLINLGDLYGACTAWKNASQHGIEASAELLKTYCAP
jgi:tetratricopeptide (TPR) repeat protein